MMRKLSRRFGLSEAGFTLIELLLVVGILAFLAAIVTPNVIRFIGKGTTSAMEAELHNVQVSIQAGMADNNISTVTNQLDTWTNDLSGKPGEFDLTDYLFSSNTEFYYKWDADGTVYLDEDGM